MEAPWRSAASEPRIDIGKFGDPDSFSFSHTLIDAILVA